MAVLDYAFLADYAAVEGGKLNVLGASFTEVRVGGFPAQQQLFVAGRVRGSITESSPELKLTVTSPDESFRIEGVVELSVDGLEPYFEDRVGLLFAIGVPVPLNAPGLYVVQVDVNDLESRTLKFTTVGPS